MELPSPLDPEQVLAQLDHALQASGGDTEYLRGVRRAVPGVGKTFGVRVPALREIAKQIHKTYKLEEDELLEFATKCWERGSREHQLVAVFIVAKCRPPPDRSWALGERFLPEVNNWETCDQLCLATFGEALAEDSSFMDTLETWADDPNSWVRRAALVTTVYLRKAKFPDELALELDRRTLAMAAALLNDPEKYIRKAVDWSVREVIRRRYALGRDWLFKMANQSPSKIAKSTLKLASVKLTPEDQDRFLSPLAH